MMKKTVLHIVFVLMLCSLILVLPASADAPTLVSTSLQNGAVNVPVDTTNQITIVFSEAINPDYVNVMFQTLGNDPAYVNYPHEVLVVGDTVTISTPDDMVPWLEYWVYNDPEPDTGYYWVTVSNVYDMAVTPMSGGVSIYFKTEPLDQTPPMVVSSDPVDEAFNVPLDVTITASMDGLMNICTGSVTLKDSNNNLISLSDPHGYYADGSDYTTLVIGPEHPALLKGETYTVTMEGLEDEYGNVLSSYSWSFTVVGPPGVVSTYPVDGASNVPADVTITATMNEMINLCIGTVEMVDSNNNPVALLYSDQYFHSTDYIHLEIKPVAPLVLGETYTVTIQGLDHQGIVMETPYSWSFTTMTSGEATQDLTTKVDSLGLPAAVETGLMDKLTAAQARIAQKKYTPARNTLNAFINQVNAQTGKAIDPDDADELIADAQRIINSIPGK